MTATHLLLMVLMFASFMLSWTLVDALLPVVNRWRERRTTTPGD